MHQKPLPKICSRVCSVLLRVFFNIMRLSESEVSSAVLCLCKEISESHSACHFTNEVMNADFLCCSITGNCVGLANDQHMMWVCVDTKISATATPTSEATPTNTPVITIDSLTRLPDLFYKAGHPSETWSSLQTVWNVSSR